MQQAARDYAILTYSPQPSIADFLRRIVESAGFAAQAASTRDELEQLAAVVVPDAIVYEIGFPFSENWHELGQLRNHSAFSGVPFVVTTPDAPELYRRVGVSAMELFRRPDDLSELKQLVIGAIETAA
jgi:DNA-binding response OmpR family regulator